MKGSSRAANSMIRGWVWPCRSFSRTAPCSIIAAMLFSRLTSSTASRTMSRCRTSSPLDFMLTMNSLTRRSVCRAATIERFLYTVAASSRNSGSLNSITTRSRDSLRRCTTTLRSVTIAIGTVITTLAELTIPAIWYVIVNASKRISPNPVVDNLAGWHPANPGMSWIDARSVCRTRRRLPTP